MGLRRAAHVAWRRIGDETVLIHLKSKKIFVLNASGGFFWHSLDGERDATDLLNALSISDALPDDASQRVEHFLRELADFDLVASETSFEAEPDRNSIAGPDYPLPRFVPPELVWQEELRNFGQSCAFMSGASPACDAAPTS